MFYEERRVCPVRERNNLLGERWWSDWWERNNSGKVLSQTLGPGDLLVVGGESLRPSAHRTRTRCSEEAGVHTSHFLTRRGGSMLPIQKAKLVENWFFFPGGPPGPRCTPSHPLPPALPTKHWTLALLHVECRGVMWKRLLPTRSVTNSFTFPS